MFRICFLSHHHTATPIPSHLHHYHHHLYLPIIFLSNTISPCLPRQQHHNLSSAQSSLFGPSSPLVSTTPMSYSILLINTLSLFLPDLMGFGNEAWSQWKPFPPGFFSLLSFYGCWYLWKFELPHPRTWRIHCRTELFLSPTHVPLFFIFPDSSVGKESTCNVGDLSLIPGSGRSPGEGKGYPLLYSSWGCKESDTTERLSLSVRYQFREVTSAWKPDNHPFYPFSQKVTKGLFHFPPRIQSPCVGLCLIAQSCPTLCDSQGLQPARLLCPWGLSRQEYWSGLSFPSPGDLPNAEIEPSCPALQANSLPRIWATREALQSS